MSVKVSALAGTVTAGMAFAMVFASTAHGSGTPGHAELYERAQQQAVADCAAAQGIQYKPFVGIHALIDGAMQGTTDLAEESIATQRIVKNQPTNPNIALRDTARDPEKWRRVVAQCVGEVAQEREAFQAGLLSAQDDFVHGKHGSLTRKGARRSYVEPESPAGPGSVDDRRGRKSSYRYGDPLPTPVVTQVPPTPEVSTTPSQPESAPSTGALETPAPETSIVAPEPTSNETAQEGASGTPSPAETPVPTATSSTSISPTTSATPVTTSPSTVRQTTQPTGTSTTSTSSPTTTAAPENTLVPSGSESPSRSGQSNTASPQVSATQALSGAVSVMQAPAYGRGDSDLARYIAQRPEYQRALRDYSACLRNATPAYYAANPDEFANKYTYAAAPAVPQWLRYHQRYAWMKRAIYTGRRCERPLNEVRNETLTKISETTRRSAD